MNTRIFKEIIKYQHKAWLGFTTRQVLFVLPALGVTVAILVLNSLLWQFGYWFIYTLIFTFTTPLLLLGLYKPQHFFFETYLKYRLNWELRVPIRSLNGGSDEKSISEKGKQHKETTN